MTDATNPENPENPENLPGMTASPSEHTPVHESIETAAKEPAPWLVGAVAAVFGLFYAYDVWEAVGNLVGVTSGAAGLGTSVSPVGWIVLIGGLLLPVVVFVLAVWLGRGRATLPRAGILFAGLCLVAALSLSLVTIFGFGALIS
ncbi:hypothetical protein [Compostimonas suwonensis]|uniref:Uncharacterized protein n=1 Tax=Compostimonas suwonensis TaxID=1048394 RepID=A0A2M9BBC9_9MICO|nr:hypothetical protein [Compostimonas suwonensis]PJJ55250.1 hypothetical protein CLV54_3388 [Compostimonas suwonensis]